VELVCDLVKQAGDRAALVDLDTIAARVVSAPPLTNNNVVERSVLFFEIRMTNDHDEIRKKSENCRNLVNVIDERS